MYSNINDTNTTIFKRYTHDIENDTGHWQEKPRHLHGVRVQTCQVNGKSGIHEPEKLG